MKFWPEVLKNIYWVIEDGRLMNFWNDLWVPQVGILKTWHTGGSRLDDTLRVSDLVDDNGN